MHPNTDFMSCATRGAGPTLAGDSKGRTTAVDLLLTEIASIEAAKESLPDDSALRTLCDLAIRPLRAHAEAIQKRRSDAHS